MPERAELASLVSSMDMRSFLDGSKDEIEEVICWCNEKMWEVGSEESFMQTVREAGKVDAKGEVQSA